MKTERQRDTDIRAGRQADSQTDCQMYTCTRSHKYIHTHTHILTLGTQIPKLRCTDIERQIDVRKHIYV